jgi:type II secretory pathway component PulM
MGNLPDNALRQTSRRIILNDELEAILERQRQRSKRAMKAVVSVLFAFTILIVVWMLFLQPSFVVTK